MCVPVTFLISPYIIEIPTELFTDEILQCLEFAAKHSSGSAGVGQEMVGENINETTLSSKINDINTWSSWHYSLFLSLISSAKKLEITVINSQLFITIQLNHRFKPESWRFFFIHTFLMQKVIHCRSGQFHTHHEPPCPLFYFLMQHLIPEIH